MGDLAITSLAVTAVRIVAAVSFVDAVSAVGFCHG